MRPFTARLLEVHPEIFPNGLWSSAGALHPTEVRGEPLIIPHVHFSSCSALCFLAVVVAGVNKSSAEHKPDKGRVGQVGVAQDLEVLPELPDPVTACDIEQTDR